MQKMVCSVEIRSDPDAHFKIQRERAHELSTISPAYIQSCNLVEGEWGKEGYVIEWKFPHGGKEMVCKMRVESIDDEKKTVSYKSIEGDLNELYKTFVGTLQVDSGAERNLVKWTFEYEKQNEGIPDPISIMYLLLNVTKDIETHLLK